MQHCIVAELTTYCIKNIFYLVIWLKNVALGHFNFDIVVFMAYYLDINILVIIKVLNFL